MESLQAGADGDHARRIWKELYGFAYQDPHGTFPTGITYQGALSGALYDGVSPLWGTTSRGGSMDAGVAFMLTPNEGTWDESILYNFCSQKNCKDGGGPGPVIIDGAGDLFANARYSGGRRYQGVLFELQNNSGIWSETVLHSFCNLQGCPDGAAPTQTLLMDASDDLLGVTYYGGTGKKHGVLFTLTPQGVDVFNIRHLDRFELGKRVLFRSAFKK